MLSHKLSPKPHLLKIYSMLLSLPTELLLEIIAHLHGDDFSQICLALTCQHMYAHIIPEVRKEHAEHVQDFLIPVGFVGIYKSDSAVVPRHKGIYGVEMHVIPAEAMLNGAEGKAFQGDTGTVNIWLLPKEGKDVRAMRSLLVSAPALKHIHLQLPSSCPLKVLVNTLSMCAARPSTRLTITDSLVIRPREITPALGRTKSSTVEEPRSSKFHLPNALRRLRGNPLLRIQQTPVITGLSITNDVLFYFEIYPVLLRLINTSPLELLHLGRPPVHELGAWVPPVRQSHWATILSSITTRATRVVFTLVPLAPADLLAFLARHPHITHLALEIFTLAGSVSFSSVPLLLPNLTTLEGVASTILPFLIARQDGHLLALQHLILKTHPAPRNPNQGQDINNHPLHAVYDHITRHSLQYASIQVTSLSGDGFISWLIGPGPGSSTSTPAGYHDAPPRRLINVEKLIFKRDGYKIYISPNLTAGMMAWIYAHAPWLTANNNGGVQADPREKHTSTDVNDTSASLNSISMQAQEKRDALTNHIIMERLLQRGCPELLDIEVLHLPEVPGSAVEIMNFPRTPGSS